MNEKLVKIGELLAYNSKPIYFGKDHLGFVIDTKAFVKILELSNVEETEEEN